MPPEAKSPAPAERFALIGISVTIAAATLAVIGVVLLTTCGPETIPPGSPVSSVCTYPFQWYGILMLYLALIPLPLLATYSYLRFEAEKVREWAPEGDPAPALGLGGGAATFFFWVVAYVVLVSGI